MVMRAAKGMKYAFAGHERNALALEKLAECRVVAYSNDGARDFERKMQIANGPAESRGFGSIGIESDFEHRLEFLCDRIHSGVALKNDRSVC
jgi:hypothetical protein